MRKWYAVYLGEQNDVIVEEGPLGADGLKRFDDAAIAGNVGGRDVIGMWIIDCLTEQEDVIKKHGHVSQDIHNRYNAYKKRMRVRQQ